MSYSRYPSGVLVTNRKSLIYIELLNVLTRREPPDVWGDNRGVSQSLSLPNSSLSSYLIVKA